MQPGTPPQGLRCSKMRLEICSVWSAANRLTAAGARVAIVWVRVDDAVAAERLRARQDDPDSQSDAGWEVYQKLKARFEPPAISG